MYFIVIFQLISSATRQTEGMYTTYHYNDTGEPNTHWLDLLKPSHLVSNNCLSSVRTRPGSIRAFAFTLVNQPYGWPLYGINETFNYHLTKLFDTIFLVRQVVICQCL